MAEAARNIPAAWDLSMPDWAQRLERGQYLVHDNLPLDVEAADRAQRIFENLRLPDVFGQPKIGDAGGEWFAQGIIRPVFGSVVDGVRMVNECFCLVPKKNSKSSFSAALMLTALLVNQRPNAVFVIVAPTHNVARLSFDQAKGMVTADPVLAGKFRIRDHLKTIEYLPTGASLAIKTADVQTITGVRISGALIDELHVVSDDRDADRLLGQLRGGMLSDPSSFVITISTQSERRPRGVFLQELNKARKIRDGELRGQSMLPILYEFPNPVLNEADHKWWARINPNIGKSLSLDRLIQDAAAAKAAGNEEWSRWASQHLNLQVGSVTAHDGWLAAAYWPDLADPDMRTLDDLLERCDGAVCGLDIGSLDDLTSLAVVGREQGTGRWLVWCHAWVNRIALERRPMMQQPIQGFIKDGDVTLIENPGPDIDQMVAIVDQVNSAGCLLKVAVDRAGATDVINELSEKLKLPEDKVVAVAQGWRLNSAIKSIERRAAEGTIWHFGQDLLLWAISNVKVEIKGNAVAFDKSRAADKIDPAVAMATAAYVLADDKTEASGDDADIINPWINPGMASATMTGGYVGLIGMISADGRFHQPATPMMFGCTVKEF